MKPDSTIQVISKSWWLDYWSEDLCILEICYKPYLFPAAVGPLMWSGPWNVAWINSWNLWQKIKDGLHCAEVRFASQWWPKAKINTTIKWNNATFNLMLESPPVKTQLPSYIFISSASALFLLSRMLYDNKDESHETGKKCLYLKGRGFKIQQNRKVFFLRLMSRAQLWTKPEKAEWSKNDHSPTAYKFQHQLLSLVFDAIEGKWLLPAASKT